tara:strand:+ start:917 stop:1639 length:723 start_codon:yes stop_codon:yes gene_type:complete
VIAGGTQRMKWKTALTAEEAVFWVLNQVYDFDLLYCENFLDFHARVASLKDMSWISDTDEGYLDTHNDRMKAAMFLDEAEEIYQALLEAIELGWNAASRSSCNVLDIEPPFPLSRHTLPDPEKCTVTKQSLANWFYHMGDMGKAKICYPAFDPERDFQKVSVDLNTGSTVNKSLVLGSKSKNSYLRTIQVLADALLSNGLTDNDSGDARLILNKLAQKGKEAPIKERALANYLKEARELP